MFVEVVRLSVCQQQFLLAQGSVPGWEVGALFLPGWCEILPWGSGAQGTTGRGLEGTRVVGSRLRQNDPTLTLHI